MREIGEIIVPCPKGEPVCDIWYGIGAVLFVLLRLPHPDHFDQIFEAMECTIYVYRRNG